MASSLEPTSNISSYTNDILSYSIKHKSEFLESFGASSLIQKDSRSMLCESNDDQKSKLEKAYLQIPSSTSKSLSVNLSRLPYNSLSDLNNTIINSCVECLNEENNKKCSSSTSCFTILNDKTDSFSLLSHDDKKHKVSSMISIKAKCDAANFIKSLPQSPTDSSRSHHHHHHHHNHHVHGQCIHHHQHHRHQIMDLNLSPKRESVSKSSKSLNKESTSPNRLSPRGKLEIKPYSKPNHKDELLLSIINNNINNNNQNNNSYFSNDGDSSSITNSNNSNSFCCSRCASPCCFLHGNNAGNFSYSVSDLYAGSLTDSMNHILSIPLVDSQFASGDFLAKTFDSYAAHTDDDTSCNKTLTNIETNKLSAKRRKNSWNFSNKITSRLKKAVKFKYEIENLDKSSHKFNQYPVSQKDCKFMYHANSNDLIFDLSKKLTAVNLNKTNSCKSGFETQRAQSFLDLTSISRKCTFCLKKYSNINIHRRNRHCHCNKNQRSHQINNIRIPKNYNAQNYRRLFGSL